MLKLSRLDRLLIRIFGSILYVPPWVSRIPLYVFKCNTHGYVVAPAQGFYKLLVCPKCLKENSLFGTWQQAADFARGRKTSQNYLNRQMGA